VDFVDTEQIFEGLNDDQRAAVEAVRGPVCILAGAGSGKTTTITRRIANQVLTGAFDAGQVMAVTFTDRAAGEMRARLHALGAGGARARTFHAAALAQLRNLSNIEQQPNILASKAMVLRQIANSLPKPYRFRPAADLATEIEWAKNRRITAEAYPSSLGDHQPPIPVDLMTGVYKRYEEGKRKNGQIDFEDLLEWTIQMFQQDEYAKERFTERYRAFTVDEYQDVNLLQETLLGEWVGATDNLCVVGDDYQSIYGFTGATPKYLLGMPQRFVNTKVFRLETNYRSTPQVLTVANRLVPNLGGAAKTLRAATTEGPEAQLRPFSTAEAEHRFLVERIRSLHDQGVPYEEMAILYRVNFRSEDYEECLTEAGIPYQVSDGAFLTRATGRQMLNSLKRSKSEKVAADVRRIADRAGYIESPPDDLGTQEATRQNDLARFVRLAENFDNGVGTGAEFAAEIEQRFAGGGQAAGVNLLTLHRAKGLEYEAVFLPRVEEGEVPFKRSRSEEAVAEERRLFYVGITRAKTHLGITWVSDGRRKPSPFIAELSGGAPKTAPVAGPRRAKVPQREEIAAELGVRFSVVGGYSGEVVEVGDSGVVLELDGGSRLAVAFGDNVTSEDKTLPLGPPRAAHEALFESLKAWRLERSKADEVPAYVVFHDSTLRAIAAARPASVEDLAGISGVGTTKIERYGPDVVRLVGAAG
jgi:DNA helicase-2/ATP-dependent DNA helicase PcrA